MCIKSTNRTIHKIRELFSSDQDISERINLRLAALIFLLLNFIFIFWISFSRRDFFYEHIENFSPDKISLTLLAFIFVLFGYSLLFFGKKERLNKKEIITIVLIFIFAILTPPFLSRDISGYLIGARNFVWFHVNSCIVGLNSVVDNKWLIEMGDGGWLKIPFSYGPFFLLIASIAVLPNFMHLIGAVYFYKLLVFLAYLASIVVFSKIVKALSLNRFLVVLYAVNPAMLINGLIDGHNDIFIALFLLYAVYFLIKKDNLRSYFFWIAAVFVKYNTLIFLPIFWRENGKFSIKKIFISVLGLVVFFALTVLFFFGSDAEKFLDYVFVMKKVLQGNCLYRCSMAVSIADLLAGKSSDMLRLAIFSLAYAGFFFKFIVQKNNYIKFIFWSFLTLVFVAARWVTPWYVLIVIPIGLLVDDRKYKVAVFLLTAYSLFHFFGLV